MRVLGNMDVFSDFADLPIISKIFERSVFNQLYEFLNANSLLSKHQFGFRPKNSTLAALIQMCDAWYENMDNGELNGVVFIDIRKAFDSINHNILLRKMKEQFGISNIELKLFESYLSDREQMSFVNGVMSAPKRIVCGVPQGSILGPLLFLLYIYLMICLIVLRSQRLAYMLMIHRYSHLQKTVQN